ncbi:MAG: DUF418 domain-containing protein [Propionibacteriaceae bacterium]|nr:DUF418 domain-containing protein [Propionibacteriaceae bacterium]
MHQKPLEPAVQLRRIVALDVLRGMAILGTFATNAGIFLGAAYADDGVEAPSAVNSFVAAALGLVTDGKWIGLLTIMFGIGLEIQRQSAIRKGERWLGTYPWRAALLVLDGLLNYLFIFEYDVLMGYGLTGLVVAVVLVTSPRVQKWVMGIAVAVHVGVLLYMDFGFMFLDQYAAEAGDYAELPEEELARLEAEWGMGQDWMVPTEGPATYWDGVSMRWHTFWDGGRAEIPIMFMMGMGLFLVGAYLYRAGIFEESGRKLRRWVMILSFGVALPIDWGTRLFANGMLASTNRYLTSACVSIGLLALVAHFYASGRQTGVVGKMLTNVGRMALTCYIGQNLIASVLFYEWGFNLARHMRFGVWNEFIAFGFVWVILIAFSTLWLRFFKRGPVEWLWHWMYVRLSSLTAGRR